MAMSIKNILKLVNGGEAPQSGAPLGGGVVAMEIDQMIARGMGRTGLAGAFSTGIVGGGNGTALDQDQPEFAIGVPAGYTMRPLRVGVQVQGGAPTDAEELEALVALDVYGYWTGDGTYTSVSPINMRTDLGAGGACRVGAAFTGNMTTTPEGAAAAAPVLSVELARHVIEYDVIAAAEIAASINLVYEPINPPFVVGPATLLVYFGGDTATIGGFVQATWVEGPSESFYVRT